MKNDNDDDNKQEIENEIVTESQTAIYHLILNDHVLEQLSDKKDVNNVYNII